MLDFGITEKEPILAEKGLGLLSVDSDNNITDVISITSLAVRESDLLEAEAISESDRTISVRAYSASFGREEVSSFFRIFTAIHESGIALEDSVRLDLFLVHLDLSGVLLESGSLSFVVLNELLLRYVDSFVHASSVPVSYFHGTKVGLGNFTSGHVIRYHGCGQTDEG